MSRSVSALLLELGWPPKDAATLAHWSYCALIGHFHLQGPVITAEQVELIQCMQRSAKLLLPLCAGRVSESSQVSQGV